MSWQIGAVTVTLVREYSTKRPLEFMFPDADPAVVDRNREWLTPFLNEDGTLAMSCHALVIDDGSLVVLVDPCVGHRVIDGRERNADERFLPDLAAAGYEVNDVDIVLCTHLHSDHVGWNTRFVDGRWVPTFPNARYLFTRIDYDHWDRGGEGPVDSFDDAVRPVVAARRADLVEMDHRISEQVWLEPTPGHSPGHVSVHIASGEETAFITGDIVHHPVQIAAPHWPMVFDTDPELAVATRTAAIERLARSGTRVFGTHFPGSSTGFVSGPPGDFRFGEEVGGVP